MRYRQPNCTTCDAEHPLICELCGLPITGQDGPGVVNMVGTPEHKRCAAPATIKAHMEGKTRLGSWFHDADCMDPKVRRSA